MAAKRAAIWAAVEGYPNSPERAATRSESLAVISRMIVVVLPLMNRMASIVSIALRALALTFALTGAGCAMDTSRLTPEQEARFQEEGIVRRADNIVFHYTHVYGYRREENRENRRASIVVTRKTVLIHKNEKVGIEITPRTRRYDVERRGTRVLIHAGTGRTGEVWSFEPDDPEGWTKDIRAVIRSGAEARRGRSRT